VFGVVGPPFSVIHRNLGGISRKTGQRKQIEGFTLALFSIENDPTRIAHSKKVVGFLETF
jgi:hypothetical protein